jgi:L-malate glycosyltransferase
MVAADRRPSVFLLGNVLAHGGTEGQFVEIACRLNRSRWNVHVSCIRAEGPLKSKLEAAGVCASSCGPTSFKSPSYAVSVLRLARALHRRRVRVLHSFDFYSNMLGVPAARLAGVPAVIASQRDLGNLRPPLERRLHNAVLRLAHYLSVNAETVADRVRKAGVAAPRHIIMIRNGVDCGRFFGALDVDASSCPITVGTVAVLRPEKGLSDLVQAARVVVGRFPAVRFVIWGDGALRSVLEEQIRNLGLAGAVTLAGATPEPEAALRGLHVFVLPSLSEASSNALLEAMATGRAIVATRIGGTPGLIEDEVTGLLVPPGDPPALAAAIIRLIEEPALAARLAARAQERARTEFSIDRMVARFEALYDLALSRSAGARAIA